MNSYHTHNNLLVDALVAYVFKHGTLHRYCHNHYKTAHCYELTRSATNAYLYYCWQTDNTNVTRWQHSCYNPESHHAKQNVSSCLCHHVLEIFDVTLPQWRFCASHTSLPRILHITTAVWCGCLYGNRCRNETLKRRTTRNTVNCSSLGSVVK